MRFGRIRSERLASIISFVSEIVVYIPRLISKLIS